MADVAVVGDGPGGLSAALLLAKNGQSVVVYGTDSTPMHYALLRNYLGVDEVPGSDFQRRARQQVGEFGASIVEAEVADAELLDDGVRLELSDGSSTRVDYVVLAAGKAGSKLAGALGVEVVDGRAVVDADQRTSSDRVYAIGRLVRPDRSQAIISAGAGAVAALDVLARESDQDHVHDWDSVD